MKTTWKHFHYGLPQEKKKPVSYSLQYPNGVMVIHGRPYPYCRQVQKQHPNALIVPNYG